MMTWNFVLLLLVCDCSSFVDAARPVRSHIVKPLKSSKLPQNNILDKNPSRQRYRSDRDFDTQQASFVQPKDLTDTYTSSASSKLILSAASAFSASFVAYFCLTFLTTKSMPNLVTAVALFFGVGCYSEGAFSDLAQALGVLALEILRRTPIAAGNSKQLVSQVLAIATVTPRRPFPPSENPWRYKRERGDGQPLGVAFLMYPTLLALATTSAYSGWIASRFIPLLPRGLVALTATLSTLYAATLRTPTGDLTRFLGFVILGVYSTIVDTAREVRLVDKLDVVTGRVTSFLSRLNEQYDILPQARQIMLLVFGNLNVAIRRLKGENDGSEDLERTASGDFSFFM